MKKVFTFLALVLLTTSLFPPQQAGAQAPDKMSYQAVIRNTGNALVANTQVGMQISIRQGTADGTSVYTETQTPTTNANGLVSIEIGTGTTSDVFSLIDWSEGPYFIKTEIDTEAPFTTYTISGTSELLSVPYALYAETAAAYTETDPKVGANTENYLSKWDGAALVQSTIFDNGKIGIGTNNPDENLHIKTTTTDGNIELEVPDGDGYYLGYNSGGDYMAISVINDGTPYWETLNLKSGNVGIGTNDPSTKLQVLGVITATGANFTGTTTVPTPVNPTDAATKAYVDVLLARLETLEILVTGSFTDTRDDNQYNAVQIGNQIWMAENLRYLPSVVGPGTGSETTPYYYVYDYDGTDINDAKATANYTTYGVLYNWPAVMNGEESSSENPSGVQGICPTGWHLPSHAEWTELTDYLGGTSVAGGKLKETGTTHWDSPNTDATNETGFTALPGGSRQTSNIFLSDGEYGNWWSSTGTTSAYYRFMYYDNGVVGSNPLNTAYGISVRCVKD